jgi:hypothetical protein
LGTGFYIHFICIKSPGGGHFDSIMKNCVIFDHLLKFMQSCTVGYLKKSVWIILTDNKSLIGGAKKLRKGVGVVIF